MSDEADLREVLAGLDFKGDQLVKWLKMERAWFDEHGGPNHYDELIRLFDDCIEAAQ